MSTIEFAFTAQLQIYSESSDLSYSRSAEKYLTYTGSTSTGYSSPNTNRAIVYRSDTSNPCYGFGQYGSSRMCTMMRFLNEYNMGYSLPELQQLIASGTATLNSCTLTINTYTDSSSGTPKPYFGACASSDNCQLAEAGVAAVITHSSHLATTVKTITEIPSSCCWALGGMGNSTQHIGHITNAVLRLTVSGLSDRVLQTYTTHVFSSPTILTAYTTNTSAGCIYHKMESSVSSGYVFENIYTYGYGNNSSYMFCGYFDFRGLTSDNGLSYDLLDKDTSYKSRIKSITLSFHGTSNGGPSYHTLLHYRFSSGTTTSIAPCYDCLQYTYQAYNDDDKDYSIDVTHYGFRSTDTEDVLFTWGSQAGLVIDSSKGVISNVELTVELWDSIEEESSAIYYFDGTSIINADLYYFDGISLTKCELYYFDGYSLVKTS